MPASQPDHAVQAAWALGLLYTGLGVINRNATRRRRSGQREPHVAMTHRERVDGWPGRHELRHVGIDAGLEKVLVAACLPTPVSDSCPA
jgi:hypothetical protein